MTDASYVYFLAHAGGDTAAAKELRDLLYPDVSVFLDAVDLKPGDKWDVELPRYQRRALATIALLGSAVEPAYYLKEEIANAIAFQRHDPDTHRLIPVYLHGIPKDPSSIPYGVRVQHALDAEALGLPGVAAELRKFAGNLANVELATLPEDSPKPADRIALYDALCKLLVPQFDEILFRVAAPTQHLAPSSEPLSRRALDLVQWAEQGGRDRMAGLSGALRRVAPGALA